MNYCTRKFICIFIVMFISAASALFGDEYVQNLLKKAVSNNDIEGIEKLISEKEINLDEPDGIGDTPLIWAVKAQAKNSLQYLIDAKVNLNHQNRFGMTALYHVYQKGNSSTNELSMAEALLKAGAKINICENTDGWNIYHRIANSDSKTDLLELLFKYGTRNSGNTRYSYSRRSQRYASNDSLFPEGLDKKDKRGNTPLHLACKRTKAGAFAMVEALLRTGVYVNIKNNNGETPLDVAKLKSIKQLLLQYHAQPGIKNNIHRNSKRSKIRRRYNILD